MASSSAGWQPIPGTPPNTQKWRRSGRSANCCRERRRPSFATTPQPARSAVAAGAGRARHAPPPSPCLCYRRPATSAGCKAGFPPTTSATSAESNVRHAVLPDGSEVELDLNTQLSFANFKDIRRVSLDRGEAYFHVTHDSAHPFVVKAGNGSITVTGTRFNVWKYQDNVVVTVTEGSVKVRSEGSGNDSSLTPGMQASYYPGLLQPLVEAVDTRQTLAWREGRLVLDDLPLSKALPLINRYLDAPLVLGDRSAAKLRIGGIYSTRDIRSLVDALPKVLPVDLEHREDGSIRISSRYAQL